MIFVEWKKKDLNIIKIHFNQREQGVGFPSLITTRITSNLENLKEIARSKNDGVEVKKNSARVFSSISYFLIRWWSPYIKVKTNARLWFVRLNPCWVEGLKWFHGDSSKSNVKVRKWRRSDEKRKNGERKNVANQISCFA